uniref:Uncharacterized protein n=1 Tax=Sinorhizobium fredii (strain HH103) TaxID=1117943 RepID=A0A0A8WK68_SINF1|nr:hypothetical protein [Sinorhizobium fredii HH103]
MRTRIGSATGDDRLGIWCEKIGPSREGDKRPASGFDINLTRKCCSAGIERDGVGCISFRWRPLIQPGIGFSQAANLSRKSETHKDCDGMSKAIVFHRSPPFTRH